MVAARLSDRIGDFLSGAGPPQTPQVRNAPTPPGLGIPRISRIPGSDLEANSPIVACLTSAHGLSCVYLIVSITLFHHITSCQWVFVVLYIHT